MARIKGIQNHVTYPSNPYLLNLEHQLTTKLSSLLNQEKQFWVLKSRINWLHGDANTRFFHTSTLKRRRNNRILSLRGQSGNWISGEIPLAKHIFSHFSNIFFTPFTISSFTESLPLHHLCFTNYEGALLSKSPSQTKIINSIKSFKPLKAPGLDDIHPFFYQKYINRILSSITNLFNEIFTSGKFRAHLNKTLFALIPKTAIPESINQYRPISLCNNIYKNFTKILVNRLRPHSL